MIANFYGSLAAETRPLILSLLKTMRAELPRVYLLATVDPHGDALQNFIFIAHRPVPPGAPVDLRRARDIEFSYPSLRRVAELELRPDPAELEALPLFSDDYAPVEYYAAQLVRRYDAGLAN